MGYGYPFKEIESDKVYKYQALSINWKYRRNKKNWKKRVEIHLNGLSFNFICFWFRFLYYVCLTEKL